MRANGKWSLGRTYTAVSTVPLGGSAFSRTGRTYVDSPQSDKVIKYKKEGEEEEEEGEEEEEEEEEEERSMRERYRVCARERSAGRSAPPATT